MFCPSCGAEPSEDLRFCRACGMELQTVSKLIDKQRSGIEPAPPQAPVHQPEPLWAKRAERLGRRLTVAGIVGFCLMMLSLVPLSMAHLRSTDSIVLWTVEILSVVLFGGVGLTYLPRLARALPGKRTAKTASLPPVESIKDLTANPNHESIPSVTEATTRRLETGD